MKPQKHKDGSEDKKPRAHRAVELVAAPAEIAVDKHRPAFGSPSTAVWNRYIDSRMKHFGTR